MLVEDIQPGKSKLGAQPIVAEVVLAVLQAPNEVFR